MRNKINILVISLAASFAAFPAAMAAERYSATVNDGTARSIEHNTHTGDNGGDTIRTNVDRSRAMHRQAQAQPQSRPAIAAPKRYKNAVDLEIDELKRQNDALQRRLQILEDAREEVRANPPVLPTAQEEAAAPMQQEVEVDSSGVSGDVAGDELPKLEPLLPVTPAPTVGAPGPAAPVAKQKRYDVVPVERVAELSERMKYANEILKRYGIAVDYRTTTLSELKGALEKLENSATN